MVWMGCDTQAFLVNALVNQRDPSRVLPTVPPVSTTSQSHVDRPDALASRLQLRRHRLPEWGGGAPRGPATRAGAAGPGSKAARAALEL